MSRKRRGDADEEADDWPDGAEHATGGYGDDDDFDYEEYLEREFPEASASRRPGAWKRWIWRAVVVVVCLLLIWRFLLL